MTRPAPGTRADYRAFVPLPTRWDDNDAYGHLNNARAYALFDTGLSLWQMGQGIALTGPEAQRFVVVESGCRYHAETGFPALLTCGLRLAHLGRSSLRVEMALFENDADVAALEGFFAQVLTDEGGASQPIPDGLRAVFERLA